MQGRGPNTPPPGGFSMSGDDWQATAVQVKGLMGQIAYECKLDRILLDETGLTGYYAFDLKKLHEKDGPTMQQQIEQELGLAIVSRKEPVTTYVIDAAEKPSVDGADVQ